jgi:hypothetical protein
MCRIGEGESKSMIKSKSKSTGEMRAGELAALAGDGLLVELGVAAGRLAAAVLRRNPMCSYLGVDAWAGDRGHDERQEAAARGRLLVFENRAALWRMRFDEALGMVPDEGARVVYVDGYAHEGNEAGATMRDWWRKVARGGWLAGHDYGREWPLNARVVDEFAREKALPVRIIRERRKRGDSWVIRKPRDWVEDGAVMLHSSSRVCVVGNGPGLLHGMPRGDVIDGFDEVVRINRYKLGGFYGYTGRRTTVWATVGHGQVPQEVEGRSGKVLMVREKQRPGYAPNRIWRVPAVFYEELRAAIREETDWGENNPKLGPSSGFVVLAWLLRGLGLPRVWVTGFDHFSKETDARHHYWLKDDSRPPGEHDGDAERRLLERWFGDRVARF